MSIFKIENFFAGLGVGIGVGLSLGLIMTAHPAAPCVYAALKTNGLVLALLA